MASTTNFVSTGQYRNLRACMVCSFVQTQQKFIKEGCPNCEEILSYRGQPEVADDCTSPVFEGLISLREPTRSWVARWQRLDGFVRGMYAVKVCGNLPVEIIDILHTHNIEYQPRDGSDTTRE